MVERGDEPQIVGQQHAVAEHVARHVADAHHRDRVVVDIEAEDATVPAHALPGAARRDPHLLVVVAVAATRGERIAEPETAVGGDLVGDVAERCRALVGRHHEVRIGLVVDDAVGRIHDDAVDHVVGHVEQRRARIAGTGRCLPRAPRRDRPGQPSHPSPRTRPWPRRARSPRSSPSAPSSARGSPCGSRRPGRSTAGRHGRSAHHADGRLRPSASTRRPRIAGAVRGGTRCRPVAASPRSRRRSARGNERRSSERWRRSGSAAPGRSGPRRATAPSRDGRGGRS